MNKNIIINLILLVQVLCNNAYPREKGILCGEELGHLGRHVAVTENRVIMWGEIK